MNEEMHKGKADKEGLQYQQIVSSLEALDDVSEAKVFQAGKDTNERLIALLVPSNDTIVFSSLRRQLYEKSMGVPVPEEFIIVDSIEKDVSLSEWKDRYDVLFKQESIYVKPRNSIEEYLVKLWGELLPIGRISITDDFFVLGGHSLLVAQMHFAIERDMGIDMDFELMLCTSVLSELALVVSQLKKTTDY